MALGDPRPTFRHILVAIDGSPHAALALQSALAIAERDHARLTLVAVAPDLLSDARLAWATVDPSQLQRDADEAAQKLLADAVAAVPGDVGVTSRFRRGSPGPEIVDQITEGDHDLALVGARGLGRFAGMVGSVSQHVLRHAPCAVFVTHTPPERMEG
jgi:nucleotide-binding universal stress UspA family protein